MKKLLVVLMLASVSLFAVCDPINDPESCVGATGASGTNGVDGANAWVYESMQAALSAMTSVELSPTHTGLSVGLGVSQTDIQVIGGAVGIMYVIDMVGESKTYKFGVNAKAYKAQKGVSGVAGGVTLSF